MPHAGPHFARRFETRAPEVWRGRVTVFDEFIHRGEPGQHGGNRRVAECTVEGIETERFLILPHPIVEKFRHNKAADYGRWLGGMRRLRRDIIAETGSTRPQDMHKLI